MASMNGTLFKIILVTNLCAVVSLILHAKGPTHRRLAANCLEEIIREHFQYGKSDVNHTMLLTVLVTNTLTSPAFEVQESVIKIAHSLAKWYQIEVLSPGERYEFQSYAECLEDECQKSFIVDFKSTFYIIIVDDENTFDEILEVLEESNTFNPKAIYLVYIDYNGPRYQEVAKKMLSKMRQKLLLRIAVLIPKTLQVFNFYKLDTATRGPYECESNVTLAEIDQCVRGNMLNIKKRYYEVAESRNFLNCSVGVIAMPSKPFVINETQGFEIEVLRSISNIINVHFNITISSSLTDTWGSEEQNGIWTGKLKYVYENYYLGAGNVETGMEYAVDFTFSRFFHMEPLVFIVPIAKFVPKWRVMIAIFTVEMWGVCLAIILTFGVFFYFASKFGEEVDNFKSLGSCLYQSFQVFIWHAVPNQPMRDFTRVFFVSLAVISIVMVCAYTTYLIYYLKNPIREHQATQNSDIMDSFGEYKYGIGGVSRYRELFLTSSKEEGTELYEMYQTATGENDNALYWIERVAEDRNIWTVCSKLYVDYLLARGHNITTDEEHRPKIYVFKKHLMSYSTSFIMRKGHPLLGNIDYVIQRLMWGGLIDRMTTKYKQASIEGSYNDEDDTYRSLAIENVQGAFVLLVMGYILSSVTCLMEFLAYQFTKRHNKKVRRRGVKKVAKKQRKGTV